MNYDVLQMFAERVNENPHAVALEQTGHKMTYGHLAAWSDELASLLCDQMGTRHGSVVAILASETSAVVPAMLAVLKAGCAFLPIHPQTPPKRIEVLLRRAEPVCAIVDTNTSEPLAQLDRKRTVLILKTMEIRQADFSSSSSHHSRLDPDDMAYIYFTSGSTGEPKAIAGRYQAIGHFVRWEIESCRIDASSRVSQLTHPMFDAYLRDVFTPLCAGGTICAIDRQYGGLAGEDLAAWIMNQQITVLHCVPSLFRTLLSADISSRPFAALRLVLLAGETLTPADVKKWYELYGDSAQIVNLYGPSETTMTKFAYFVDRADANKRNIPIGLPMPEVNALLVGHNGKPCPPGDVGEIYIQTKYTSLGYYRQPELTRDVFVPNPFGNDPTDLVYKTGDLARVSPEGLYQLLGRRDLQVKIGGARIELQEIESGLRLCPGVKDAVVIDKERPSGDRYLCAYMTVHSPVDVAFIRQSLAEVLPEYAVPSTFVFLEEFPKTITGKVDRLRLPEPSEEFEKRTARSYVAPRTAVEEELCAIWARLLGVTKVGIHHNFFELGGNSLLATQILSRVWSEFGVRLAVRSLVEMPTVAQLAIRITEAQLDGKTNGAAESLVEQARAIVQQQAKGHVQSSSNGAGSAGEKIRASERNA